jgi:hypothetical protein
LGDIGVDGRIKDLREIQCGIGDWLEMVQDIFQFCVKTVMKKILSSALSSHIPAM